MNLTFGRLDPLKSPMRLFLAIPLPQDVIDKFLPIQQKLVDTKSDVRWVSPDNYHITLKFLGELPDDVARQAAERIVKASAKAPAFALEAEGIDRLPPRGNARVIISRILSPDQRITRLHRLVDSALGGMGLPMDTRVYVPHLTLGRVRSNHGLNRLLRLIEKHDLDFFGSFTVDKLLLMQSILGAGTDGGSQYQVLTTSPLAPAPEPYSEPG